MEKPQNHTKATDIKRLEQIYHEQCKNWAIELIEFRGEEDHIHLLLDMHPNIRPSRFINSLKTVSSRLIRKAFSSHLEKILLETCVMDSSLLFDYCRWSTY